MHRRSARARRIYTCSSGRKKRTHRSALVLCRRPCRWVASTVLMLAHMLGLATVLRGTWIYNHAEQLYTVAALVLDASTCVAAAAGSSLIDLHLNCVVDLRRDGLGCRLHRPCSHDLACITTICDAEQLYTEAALVLDASTRVAKARKRPHRSALCIRRRPCRWVASRINRAHARSCEEADLASLGWI